MNSTKKNRAGMFYHLNRERKLIVIAFLIMIPLSVYKAIKQEWPGRERAKIERCEALMKKTEKPGYADERSDCVEYLASRKRSQK